MKKKTSKMIIVLFIFIVIWLMYSNTIIVNLFSKESIPQEIEADLLENAIEANGTIAIDYIYFLGNILENCNLEGWVAFYDENAVEATSIDLILESEECTYKIEGFSAIRSEVQWKLNHEGNGLAYSFGSQFPTVALRNGEYDLKLLYNYASGQYLVSTGRRFLKTPQGFSQIFNQAIQFEKLQEGKTVYGGINTEVAEENHHIKISGWACLANEKADSQTVFVGIQMQEETLYYPAIKGYRKDVVEYFGNLDYGMSGFEAFIPEESLYEGADIYIVVDGYLWPEKYSYSKTDGLKKD